MSSDIHPEEIVQKIKYEDVIRNNFVCKVVYSGLRFKRVDHTHVDNIYIGDTLMEYSFDNDWLVINRGRNYLLLKREGERVQLFFNPAAIFSLPLISKDLPMNDTDKCKPACPPLTREQCYREIVELANLTYGEMFEWEKENRTLDAFMATFLYRVFDKLTDPK